MSDVPSRVTEQIPIPIDALAIALESLEGDIESHKYYIANSDPTYERTKRYKAELADMRYAQRELKKAMRNAKRKR